jgi:hypothetical protein
MKTEEIEEGNRLIAEFEGMKHVNDDPEVYPEGYMYSENEGTWKVSDLQYHASWDWLMPVVEKINSVPFQHCHITKFQCIITTEARDSTGFLIAPTKTINVAYREISKKPLIEIVWEAVLQYIKFYNSQKT